MSLSPTHRRPHHHNTACLCTYSQQRRKLKKELIRLLLPACQDVSVSDRTGSELAKSKNKEIESILSYSDDGGLNRFASARSDVGVVGDKNKVRCCCSACWGLYGCLGWWWGEGLLLLWLDSCGCASAGCAATNGALPVAH